MPFTKTFHGFIENITDTLLIIEACRNGILPTVNRRLVERERSNIKSGTIIVFNESESGIKRWTDGFLWSPSRILGNFLVYRELENRENRKIDYQDKRQDLLLLHQQRERALVGSLTTANTSYNFKPQGLIKKTIRIMVNHHFFHIVSYYNKQDVLNHLLPTPSTSPQLACLQIPADLLPHLNGYTHASNLFPMIHQRKRSNSSSASSHHSIEDQKALTRENETKHYRPHHYSSMMEKPFMKPSPPLPLSYENKWMKSDPRFPNIPFYENTSNHSSMIMTRPHLPFYPILNNSINKLNTHY